jgi:hypothetical protein
MYGTLLIICKIMSDALAAAFGMLGLLFDFKDDHKRVTRTGRIALIGILASFLMSAVITGLEAKKSHDESEAQKEREAALKATHEKSEAEMKAAYEHGSQKVMRPFDHDIQVGFLFEVDKSSFRPQEVKNGVVPEPEAIAFYKQDAPCADFSNDAASVAVFEKRADLLYERSARLVAHQKLDYDDNGDKELVSRKTDRTARLPRSLLPSLPATRPADRG